MKELRRRKLRDRIYRLKMTSYGALTFLLAAFGWYLAESDGLQYRPSAGPYALFSVGAGCYLVIRIYLYKNKAALKKLGF